MSWKMKQYLGLALVALAFFLVWTLDAGTAGKASALRSAIEERTALVREREDIIAAIKQFQQEYAAQSVDIRRFAALLPERKSSAELVSALQTIAADTGVTIANLSMNDSPAADAYQEMNVVIEAQGSYPSLVRFLQEIEQNVRLIDIQSVEASADARQSSALTIKLQAKTYFLE